MCSSRLVIYSRAYCHLCDDMIASLQALQSVHPFAFEIVDVDGNPELEDRYGERVPVLVAADIELCHYHLDAAKVNDFLSKLG